MSIKKIFDEISAEPGTNKKVEILQMHSTGANADLLKEALYFANSPRVKYYIKQIPVYRTTGENIPLHQAFGMLSRLSKREVSGTDASNYLADVLSKVSADDAYIIERVIEKDCKIGMGVTQINKVFKKLVEETPYMGAQAFDKKLVENVFLDKKNAGYAYSQIKMDGRYLNAIITDGNVILESRAGEATVVTGAKFLRELERFPDCVLNGELTMDGISRYESNGIIASIISILTKKHNGENVAKEVADFEKKKSMRLSDALEKIRYTVWDTITVDEYLAAGSKTPYHDRLVNLSKILKPLAPEMVSFIPTKKVYNYKQAMEHFQEVLSGGHEGTILKASMGEWKDGKPNWQIKMKLEMKVDLIITGFNYGTGKNKDVISSLTAESSDSRLITRPTGIKEDMMDYITRNMDILRNKIVEVECNGVSKDSQGNYSLLYPRFKHVRTDKFTADSLEQILKIEDGAKTLAAL